MNPTPVDATNSLSESISALKLYVEPETVPIDQFRRMTISNIPNKTFSGKLPKLKLPTFPDPTEAISLKLN